MFFVSSGYYMSTLITFPLFVFLLRQCLDKCQEELQMSVAKQSKTESELRQLLRQREKLDRMHTLLRNVEAGQQKHQTQLRMPNQQAAPFQNNVEEKHHRNATEAGHQKQQLRSSMPNQQTDPFQNVFPENNYGNATPITNTKKSSVYTHSPMSASPKFHSQSKKSLGPLSEAAVWSETAHTK
jgi:hypothetical protein